MGFSFVHDLRDIQRFECVLWPIYGTFAPLHLAVTRMKIRCRTHVTQGWEGASSCTHFLDLDLCQDPTCDHNEEEAMLDSLMLPAWCASQ